MLVYMFHGSGVDVLSHLSTGFMDWLSCLSTGFMTWHGLAVMFVYRFHGLAVMLVYRFHGSGVDVLSCLSSGFMARAWIGYHGCVWLKVIVAVCCCCDCFPGHVLVPCLLNEGQMKEWIVS